MQEATARAAIPFPPRSAPRIVYRPSNGRAVRGQTHLRLLEEAAGQPRKALEPAALTAQTRQQILRVYRLGQNLEFVSLGTGAVQKICGGSLA